MGGPGVDSGLWLPDGTGTLTAVGALDQNSGLLTITAMQVAAGGSLSGTVSAASGGRLTLDGTVGLGDLFSTGPIIAVDSHSSVEIGAGGDVAPDCANPDTRRSAGIRAGRTRRS